MAILAMVLVSGCVSQKDFITESDYSYYGKFRKYKNFDFMQNLENDSFSQKYLLEKTISSRLNAQGYSLSKHKPDLLITYKIFYRDLKFRGYDQPYFEDWIDEDQKYGDLSREEKGINPITGIRDQYMTEEYNIREYHMNKGTLLIVFFDTKKKKTVWQGYASGIYSSNPGNTYRNIKIATAKILNEFRLIADGYVVKGGT